MVVRELLGLAWPLALSGLVTVAISGNDTVLLGQLGAEAIAVGAVAVAVYSVVAVLLTGFGVPAQVLTARHHGAGEHGDAARTAERTATVALWLSIPLTCVLLVLAEPLVGWIAGSAVDAGQAAAYLRILLVGLPVFAIGVVLRGFATGIGRSRVVLVSGVATFAVDVGASLLLIALGYGTLGVAVGTLLGSCVPTVVSLGWLRRIRRGGVPGPRLRKMLGRVRIEHREAWAMGWPEAAMMACAAGATVVVTVLLAPSGPVALATARTLDVAVLLVWMVIYGVAAAGTTLLAQRIGAGDAAGLRRVVGVTAVGTGGVALLCATLLPLVTPAVLRLAVDDPRVAAAAEPVVWIAWTSVLWMAATATTNAVLRSNGDTRTPLRASLIGEYAVFLPVGWLLCRVLDLGLTGVFVANHIFWAAFLAVGAVTARRYLRRPTVGS
ncbi:MAG: MATE family efflux transporter [Pseudonocardia sp.]